jgi:hypothetical protein
MATKLACLVLASIVLSNEGCGMGVKSELHIIPQGFVGPVVIVFDQPVREEALRDDAGALVYKIPTHGVLCVSNSAPKAGFYRKQFYYEAADGELQELPHRVADQSIQVFADGYGVTEVLDGKPTGSVRWLAYVVGTPRGRTDWVQLRDAAVERAVRSAVEACRAELE